jgi:hypothetical protein
MQVGNLSLGGYAKLSPRSWDDKLVVLDHLFRISTIEEEFDDGFSSLAFVPPGQLDEPFTNAALPIVLV